MKILKQDLSELSPEKKLKFQKHLPHVNLSFTPLKEIRSTSSGRKKGTNLHNETYIGDLFTSNFSIFRERTPQKSDISPDRVQFDPMYNKDKAKLITQKLNFEDLVTSEHFSFDIQLQDLMPRGKRIPQKQVMSYLTSREYLEAFGIKLLSETQSKVEFHWAHRQGWSLNGSQSKENLDATTAGSNIDTLFKVETPIRVLLKENLATTIHVEGTVHFIDSERRVAESIIYHFTWNNDKSCTVIIDPLSLRFPTRDEADVAKMIVRLESK